MRANDRRIFPSIEAFDLGVAHAHDTNTRRDQRLEARRSRVPVALVREAYELDVTAHHEAGHAVVGILLGIKIAKASVVPCGDLAGRVVLASHSEYRRLWQTRRGRRAYYQFLEAGMVAQSIWTGGMSFDKCSEDLEKMNGLAKIWPNESWYGFGALYGTETMLRRNRTAFAAIAEGLRRRGTLTGRTLERIVRELAA